MTKFKKAADFFGSLKWRLILLFLLIGIVPSILVRAGMLGSYENRAVFIRTSEILSQAKILANQIVSSKYLNNAVPSILVRAGMLGSYENRAVFIRTSEILSQAKILANQIVSSKYLNNAGAAQAVDVQLEQFSTIYDGRVMIIDDSFHIVRDTYAIDNGKTIISEEVMKSFAGEEITKYDAQNRYIELTMPLVQTDEKADAKLTVGVMMVSVSTDSIHLNLEYLATSTAVILLACIFAILVIAYFASVRLVKPLHTLSQSIEEVQTGYGEDALFVDDYTETREICEKFNGMLGRMKVLDDSRQEFVSNEEVQTGYGEDALFVDDYTETREICEKFNGMLGRMKVLDDSRQEFVSNVSHELKTPLTSMKVLADSINSMENAPVELYQEFMVDIGNEVERETKIINDLLSLVKMDKSAADLNITNVNVNELVELILKRLKPIAEKQKVELVLESFRPVSADIDEVKLTLAFTNLIENGIKYNKENGWVHVSLNADHQYFYLKVEDSGMGIPEESLDAFTNLIENGIKYNKENGWVHVSLNADHQYFYLKVEDSGMGIPEESLEHIFERFYRVDKSHSREIGGTGLGLAITRNAILMHRGAIKVFSTEGEGTIFNVRIPLNYIS